MQGIFLDQIISICEMTDTPVPMIDQYNQRQVIRGMIAALLSIIAYLIAFLFFKIAWALMTSSFDENVKGYDTAFAIVCLGIVTWAGILHGRAGEGHYGFGDSGLQVRINADSGGAFFTQHYANRVTAPAYVLSQIFLAGPLQMIKCQRCFRSRIAKAPGLEPRLIALQKKVESRPKRHLLSEYPGQESDIFMLARMDRIAFSARKGTVFRKE